MRTGGKKQIDISDRNSLISNLVAVLACDLLDHKNVTEGARLRIRALAKLVGAPVPAMD